MTAVLTLAHRPGPVDVADPATVRQIAEAVAAYNRDRSDDRKFRIRRSTNLAIRFRASDVTTLDANGINLVDLGNPFGMAQVVA